MSIQHLLVALSFMSVPVSYVLSVATSYVLIQLFTGIRRVSWRCENDTNPLVGSSCPTEGGGLRRDGAQSLTGYRVYLEGHLWMIWVVSGGTTLPSIDHAKSSFSVPMNWAPSRSMYRSPV